MKDYLILLPKSSFTDLFKYGYLYTDSQRWILFDGDTISLSNNIEVRDKVFDCANAFDYTFTYLIVHFKAQSTMDGRIDIGNVQNLFPLDNDGKREIELSLDQRIRINEPIWSSFTHELQIKFLYDDAEKGASNIWEILKLETPISEAQEIFSNENLKEIVREVFYDLRPKGELPFWVYLMRYERHGFFPKTTKGYFYDLINVYINKIQYQELPAEAIETTSIYTFLNELPMDLHLEELLDILSEEQLGRNFLDKVNEIAGLKTYGVIVAILFLDLRNKFAKGFYLDEDSEKYISHSVSTYPRETQYALYLLGLYLGNSHTFECLYDTLPLPIFKPSSAEKIDLIQHGEVENTHASFPCPVQKEDEISNPQIFSPIEEGERLGVTEIKRVDTESLDENNETFEPITMRKKADFDAGIKGRKGTKRAKNKQQYDKYLKEGYVPDRK